MVRTRKPLDFEKHVRAITRVAGAKRAPEQLGLDEQLPDQTHELARVQGTEWGYVAHCQCGWSSREVVSRPDAHREFKRHIARTPQGAALLKTVRRVGRSSNGA